jgi:hypothetical protein
MSWQHLNVREVDNGERWSIVWDTKRKPGTEDRNRAEEKTERAAIERARHLLRMGFIVYEICDPAGVLVIDEAALRQRLGLDSAAA